MAKIITLLAVTTFKMTKIITLLANIAFKMDKIITLLTLLHLQWPTLLLYWLYYVREQSYFTLTFIMVMLSPSDLVDSLKTHLKGANWSIIPKKI